MSEMVERVARAIEPLLFASENPKLRAAAIDKAIYAIAAMREPTEAMWKAGQASIDKDEAAANAHFVWRDMLDAALAD